MEKPFAGKVALVTGGNSGIGRATALAFAAQGAAVVIGARRVEEGNATVAEIRAAGGRATFVPTDVSIAADVEALVARTVAEYGRLDCAFNNAGVSGGALLHETTEADWDRMIAVNLKGVWLCLKYEIIQMLRQGGGAIVNDSSVAGLIGYGRSPHYAASKHGVIGLTKSASLQYATKGIRINAVCPGMIKTPMIERAIANPGVEEWFLSRLPMGRPGQPEEVARAVTWLCSDAASFVSGTAFPVDGATAAGLA
ncbi:MAG: SDR family oxidoreductase [Gemmatimonadales bacterium]|nr:SDR family oxidoreductase [Gemmatimonadales bacterium]